MPADSGGDSDYELPPSISRLGFRRPVERAVDALAQLLHIAALLVDMLLDQPLGSAEGIVDGKLGAGKAVVSLRRVVDVDVDAARQRQVNVGVVKAAGAMVLVWNPDDDVAGGQSTVEMLEGADVLDDHLIESFTDIAALKADPQRRFHCARSSLFTHPFK
jgi:hypothetical protein